MSKEIKLPLFPLNLVLLPTEEISLHIFEDKYKIMINNCIDKNEDFGVILRSKQRNSKIGCTAEIVDVMFQDENGEFDIVVRGSKRFTVNKSMADDKSLLYGYISILKESEEKPKEDLISKVQNKYLQILLNHKLTKDFDIEMSRNISYDFTKKIILPNNLKQLFLEIQDEVDRMVFLNNLFDKVIVEKNNEQLSN